MAKVSRPRLTGIRGKSVTPAEPVIEVAPGEPHEHCDYCFTVKPCVLEDSSGRMMCQDCLDKAAASTGAPVVPAQEALGPNAVAGYSLLTTMPAQEAPRETVESCPKCGIGWSKTNSAECPECVPAEPQAGAQPICKRCGFRKGVHHRITGICPGARSTAFEPAQAGAQVPSQEHPMRLFVRGMTREQLEAYALKVFASMIATEQTLWRTEAHLNTIKSYATEAAKTPITRESILAAPQVDEAPIPENLKMAYGMYKKSGLGGPAELIERIAQLEAENRARKLTELAQFDEMQGFCRLVLSEIGGGL